MNKQVRPSAIAIAKKLPACHSVLAADRTDEAGLSTKELCGFSRHGLWQMLLFLLISMAAYAGQDFDLFAVLPRDLWTLFGAPPPPPLIHLVLGIYTFCALMLLPARMRRASLSQSWVQTGYRTIFYLFYLSANALVTSFIFVFVAGLILYAAEQSFLLLRIFRTLHGAELHR